MRRIVSVLSCGVAGLIIGTAANAGVDSGEFTFQGQLKIAGVPVNDICDFEFSLWSDEFSMLAVDQVGTTLIFDGLGVNPSIVVENGLFSAVLDFGPTAFTDDPRWIDVSVSCPAGSGIFTALTPRSLVTGVPHSIHTRGIAVDAGGDVGIGTDRPFARLTVRESKESSIALSSNYSGMSGNAGLFGCSNSNNAETALSVLHAGPGKGLLSYQHGTGIAGRFEIDNPLSNATALQAVITRGLGQAAYFGGDVGVGTQRAEGLLHVKGVGTACGEHVAFFENTSRSPTGDGIAIQINNLHTNRENNFITFYNGAKRVTGRIEGFDLENGDWISPPPMPNLNFSANLGKTLGRAWSESDNDVYSFVNVAIGLEGNEATIILRRQHELMETQARQHVVLAAENSQLRQEMMAVNAKLAGMLASFEKLEEQLHAQTLCHPAVAHANVKY